MKLAEEGTLAAAPFVSSVILAASHATVELFVRHGSSDLPIRTLAANAGISERTFYRYFPRKEDAVWPFLEAGLERVLAAFTARPRDETVLDSLQAVWADSWPVRRPEQSRVLHDILGQSDRFRAIRVQVVVESELRWAAAIAPRLGLQPSSRQAAFIGAGVVSAFRLAWKAFSEAPSLDAAATVRAYMRLASALFPDDERATAGARRAVR